jgi:hypothetical protein
MHHESKSSAEAAEQSPPRAANRFARHAVLTRIVLILAMLGMLEAFSFVAVRLPGFYKEHNRMPSGYYVFRNNPAKVSRTWQRLEGDPKVVFDEHGFTSSGTVSIEKEPGTRRIFLMGGSTAAGMIQYSSYRGLHGYPRGLYTFRDSIAGQLQTYLDAQRPELHFEVITASAVSRTLHQSLIYYLETVSRFSPDWVVSLDGYNDISHIQSGTPYADREEELQYYIDIQNSADCINRTVPNTYCLVDGIYNRITTELTRGRRRPAPDFTKPFILEDHTRERYLERKSHLIPGAERMTQTLGHLGAALNVDGVRHLFVLQPLLHRTGENKALSEIETMLANGVSPALYTGLTDQPSTTPVEYLDALLILKYFFDDHLSAALADQAQASGHLYLDMNRELRDVPAAVEVYTDYCHLTIEGNRRVAEKIGEAILSTQPSLSGN